MLTHLLPFMSIHLGTPLLAAAEAVQGNRRERR